MREAARLGATPLLHGLPDDIVICEILVRLDPKSLLRCRAVCCIWRSVTSARDFLLFHHGRQTSLPILYGYCCEGNDVKSTDIIPFNHRAALAADQLHSVARLDYAHFRPVASSDGLLILSFCYAYFTICNPVTRQFACLGRLSGFSLLGIYPHPPTGEYRLLMHSSESTKQTSFRFHDRTNWKARNQVGCYVLSLGSGKLWRYIDSADTNQLQFSNTSVLLCGCLHCLVRHGSDSNMIMVFDTIAESIRMMLAPVFSGGCDALFEMDGKLGMSSSNDAKTIIDIWVLQEYESEDCILKCQIKLPVTEIKALCKNHEDDELWDVVAVHADGKLFVLIKCTEWLLQVDMDGKLVATFHHKGVRPTQLQLKQSLVPHAFFPSLHGYVVNGWPFIRE
ncbi:hypothetical protein CFC21_049833 [Triticum aestivum]|uniref:F-box domain-containing protein n=2 Tax=Triticum aestivum TaxID=4565 RepID=A0A3B6H5A6_WHEAT|nr:hypothetical protein CFC21_049833 [Triticum aestivum]